MSRCLPFQPCTYMSSNHVREVWGSIPSNCLDFLFRSIFLAFFFRDCVNILRNISCPIYSILFLFPRARKTRIIPFLFYATPPRIEARRIERISGILGHGQVTPCLWRSGAFCSRRSFPYPLPMANDSRNSFDSPRLDSRWGSIK